MAGAAERCPRRPRGALRVHPRGRHRWRLAGCLDGGADGGRAPATALGGERDDDLRPARHPPRHQRRRDPDASGWLAHAAGGGRGDGGGRRRVRRSRRAAGARRRAHRRADPQRGLLRLVRRGGRHRRRGSCLHRRRRSGGDRGLPVSRKRQARGRRPSLPAQRLRLCRPPDRRAAGRDRQAHGTDERELEAAITPSTACVVYFAGAHFAAGALPLEQAIADRPRQAACR